MVFTVLVAADVYGTKGNFEVTFPSTPTLAELTRQTESIYGVEASARRPVGTIAAPFLVSRFQLYNDKMQQWVDLTSPTQLVDRAQVFAFQTAAAPAPVPAPSPAAAAASVATAIAHEHVAASNLASAHAAQVHATANANVAAAVATTQLASHVAPQQIVAAHTVASQAAAVHAANHAVAQVAQQGIQMPVFSDTATHEDKTRAVFEGFDTNGNRVLEPEECRQAFDLLHIDFSGATVSDLVQKADADKDGVISFPEWQAFSERFPTLIDSFYFRLKAYWEDVRRQQEIRSAKELLAELKERSQQSQVAWLEAQRDSDAARTRLSAQEAALAQAIDVQRAAEQALLEGRRDVERATADRLAREQELLSQRDREAQATQLHSDAVRDTEAAHFKLTQAQAAVAEAQERERQTAQVLAEAQAEVERQRQLTSMRSAEVTEARSREQAAALAATEAVRDATLAGERLSRADLDVAAKQQREKELEASHAQAQFETHRGTVRRDEEAQALQVQRQQEEAAHVARLEAQRITEEADRKVVALEAENTAFAQKRRTVEEQEAPLLDQEIRLRSQRDALEEKEARLRGDHKDFCEATRSGSPIASPAAVAAALAGSPARRDFSLAAAAAAHANASIPPVAAVPVQTSAPLAAAPAFSTLATTPALATPRTEYALPTSRSVYSGIGTELAETPLKPGRLA
eukprot:TRINITY_DN4649_c1_g3_i1.p1 TRINITY_DN4649_c1_g3~~TRINITY_DN4649_c1_g3_i1.p1  ORF type:complete len:713 (+),score=210.90 TRINITY_DN4649_c1_g3_i1:65-2140(+)